MYFSIWISLFLLHSISGQNSECQAPILGHWENMTITEGGIAVFKCPMETVKSCPVESVQWSRIDQDGTLGPITNSRVEIFPHNHLKMYMTDTELSDDGWYACTAINSKGSKESKVYLQILKDPLKVTTTEAPITTTPPPEVVVPVVLPKEEPVIVPDRNVVLQMSGNSALMKVVDTPPLTTTEAPTTPRRNKWEAFQVYSKHRGSRVSYPGAGFGAAYAKALAMNNVTLIPRREEDMMTNNLITSTRPPLPDNWIITTTRSVPRPPTTNKPAPKPTTLDPRFILYNQLVTESTLDSSNQPPEALVSNPSPWTQGGKNSLPNVGEHLTNRDHLEAIHDHLRYIYDRLDDLLDRIHVLESNQRN